MMMRRGAVRLAVAAASAAAGTHDIQPVEKDVEAVPTADPTTATPATQQPTYKHVHTVNPPASTFIPSASEAPELLQSYVEPKPFISARRLQVFTVSMGVGAFSVSLVYFFLSKSISTRVEEEQTQLDRITERNRLAMQDRMSVVPNFTAPNSYDELYAKMIERDKEVESQLAQSRSTLHTETMFHLRMWWNRCLRNIQAATDAFANAQLRRKEAQAEANIKTTLRCSGYKLMDLKKVERV
ncbi:putative mitochondrial hypothetical protein [Leptomonas pyrrhocoris]|uniref:Transmembrane protein n=1 Tax=Leptomonas pyrrhocoris TaxID=157538 RepID=A0A0N0VHT2_LEPPY|nr:putative mitochondrial hypothetical protein [Leptomonas pyrrhocoris]XP_015664994.1 putative mitochondrial hypothetical protein [Leptomonas pyrrhocoris]KPA86554.1 putative mitochondrial hypothetical protein [Leptomonas pyrrhocoris]KPA86555.1 putative mitochondrial hypothetical protein [Leptomonas pyrrhocoris]|eukprot:XP_015664993.1 putative mitochondrial hypothetical protein [Leptomonas pyrrhocoris]